MRAQQRDDEGRGIPRGADVSGFLQVPEAALELAADWQDECIVFGIYRLADANRYEPFKAASRMLRSRFGGASGRRVEAMMSALMSAGLVVLVTPGTPRKPRVVRVLRWREWADGGEISVPADAERNAGGHAGGNAPPIPPADVPVGVLADSSGATGNAGGNAGGSTRRARSITRPQTPDTNNNPPPPSGVGSAPPIPAWVPKQTGGQPRREVGEGALRVLATITGRPCKALDLDGEGRDLVPERAKGAASAVLKLWKALGWPAPAEFVADACLVARAAHRCPHPLFARDIRAEGWDRGTDRRRVPSTILVQSRWDDRLAEALRWRDAGEPAGAPHTAAPTRNGRPMAPTPDEWLNMPSLGLDNPPNGAPHGD